MFVFDISSQLTIFLDLFFLCFGNHFSSLFSTQSCFLSLYVYIYIVSLPAANNHDCPPTKQHKGVCQESVTKLYVYLLLFFTREMK